MNGKQLKNSILQWAIQGKLVPQDPNDEPASVLLERIREEKARLVKEGKIKKDKNESIIFRGDDNSHYEKFVDGTVKCIDDEIPFEIPEGWEWVRISTIAVSQLGKTLDRGKDVGQEYPYLCSINVYYDGIDLSKVKRFKLREDELSKYRLQKGDLLICEGGDYGRCCVWDREEDMYYQNALHRVRFYCGLLPAFFKYVFELYRKIGYIVGQGQTIKHFTYESMKSIVLPLPTIEDQYRIVSKIEELLPLINRYNSSQRELDELNSGIQSRLKKSILQEAIQGKLVPQDPNDEPASVLLGRIREEKQRLLKEGKLKKKDITDSVIFKGEDNKYYEQIGQEIVDINEDIPFEIPELWSWIRLSNICSICTGATFKKEDATQNQRGVRILRGGNILPFRICIKDDDIFIPRDAVKYNILLRQNDIVTPAVTSLENIGKMARIESDMPTTTVGGFVFILRPYLNDDILSEYLLSAMSAPTTVEFMRSITNKSGQAFYNIGKERLSTTLIPVPPHVEQKRIIENIKHLFSKLS